MSIPEATVQSMGELIDALRQLAPDFGRTEYWYRGVRARNNPELGADVRADKNRSSRSDPALLLVDQTHQA